MRSIATRGEVTSQHQHLETRVMSIISPSNPVGLTGIEFTEFCGPTLEQLDALFLSFGFSKLRRHPSKAISYYRQNDITSCSTANARAHSAQFARSHGPSISAMGWRVENAAAALTAAVARGAVAVPDAMKDHAYPAVWGIGESIIYFIEAHPAGASIYERDFVALDAPVIQPGKGFLTVDHLTNNVPPASRTSGPPSTKASSASRKCATSTSRAPRPA